MDRRVLLPTLDPAVSPLQPSQQWDLQAAGLTTKNWEGHARDPPLLDERPTLLLISDDNFTPLQTTRLARITLPCPAPR